MVRWYQAKAAATASEIRRTFDSLEAIRNAISNEHNRYTDVYAIAAIKYVQCVRMKTVPLKKLL